MTSDDHLHARLAAIDPVRPGRADGQPSPQMAQIQGRVRKIVASRMVRFSARRELGGSGRHLSGPLPPQSWLLQRPSASFEPLARRNQPAVGTDRTGSRIAPTDALSSCVPFDVVVLRRYPGRIRGIAVEVGAESVTIDVDRWYAGGAADRVTVYVPDPQTSVSLDGVQLSMGGAVC